MLRVNQVISRGKISTLVSLSMSKTRGLVALLNPANLLSLKALKFDPPEVNQVISRSKISTPVSLYMSKNRGLVALLNPAGDSNYWNSVLISEPGGFPMLNRVSVKIWWYSGSMESFKDKFPRLVESKAVTMEFNFERNR